MPNNKPVCPECGSSHVLYRSTKAHPYICRRCGHEWGEKKEEGGSK